MQYKLQLKDLCKIYIPQNSLFHMLFRGKFTTAKPTVYGAFHCSLVTAVSEKEAILLTRVAGQMFGAYLPDKTLLDLTGVPKKQVTLESCHNPEIRIGHPDAVR